MDMPELISSLHPLERKLLPLLQKPTTFEQLIGIMPEIEVRRALQWLKLKQLVAVTETTIASVQLGQNGEAYLKEGLPETRLLNALNNQPAPISELAARSGLSPEETSATLGLLRSTGAVEIIKDKQPIVKITQAGKAQLKAEPPEIAFLKHLPANADSVDKPILESLRRRKDMIKLVSATTLHPMLTELGQQVINAGINLQVIDSLNSSILRSGDWRGKQFRRYDISSQAPKIHPGKRQHYRQFLDEIREKFMALGFEEMFGPIVESDFWDMDALFMPQFHSARDIHDAYYIKEPKYAHDIPPELLKKVQASHENGYGTGSTGWRYPFDTRRTARQLLRTQGTACSSRKLASDVKIPGKYFAIARCFRYDVIDATHLPDFNQTEGIVAEKGLTLRHLFGLLKLFAKEFAQAEKVKITPAYFPFTEPSATLYAKHPVMGWIELGGSGIFRPEMTKALGIDVPVIAWGIGIDRIAMFKLGLNDIRQLFSHDLSFLRNSKVI